MAESWEMVVEQQIQGVSQLQDAMPQAVARGMYSWGEQVMTRAKHLVPVETGALKSSGHVLAPVVKKDKISVTLGFGGPAGSGNHGNESNDESVGYAVRVHEDMTANHVNGQAKYLESPMAEAMPQLGSQVQPEVEKDLKKIFKGK